MRMILAALGVAFATLVAACSGPDASAYQMVDQVYGAIQRGDTEAVVAATEPAQQASVRAGMAQLTAMLPQGEPTSSANAGWHVQVNAGQARQTQVTRTYTYPDRVVTARAILIDGPGTPRWIVRGFNINTSPSAGAASAAAPAASAPQTAPAAPEAGSGGAPTGDAGVAATPPASGEAPSGEGNEAAPAEGGESTSGSPVEGQ